MHLSLAAQSTRRSHRRSSRLLLCLPPRRTLPTVAPLLPPRRPWILGGLLASRLPPTSLLAKLLLVKLLRVPSPLLPLLLWIPQVLLFQPRKSPSVRRGRNRSSLLLAQTPCRLHPANRRNERRWEARLRRGGDASLHRVESWPPRATYPRRGCLVAGLACARLSAGVPPASKPPPPLPLFP